MANKGEGGYSTQKMPKHDSHASGTESSHSGKSSKTYVDGAKSGGGGAKRDPDGAAPAAGPKTFTTNT